MIRALFSILFLLAQTETKGARTKDVEHVLASLEARGHVVAVGDEPKQWRVAR